jgi:hypothetical protein
VSAPQNVHRRRLPVWKKTVFAMAPLCVLLLVGELAARLSGRVPFHLGSFRVLRLDQVRRGYPTVRDPYLGYAPQPSYSSRENAWGKLVTIDADGLRVNGPTAPPTGKPIVAVGDSFTFGDQVSDSETWPAYLEQELQRPVKNGGVFGYSLGQSVLRAQRILQQVPADWLIVSFIATDIDRCEYSKRYTIKPYFDVENGELVLRNVPVPEVSSNPEEIRLRTLKNALGVSGLLDWVLAHSVREWWYGNEKRVRVHPEGKGVELAKRLVDRTATLCRERPCRLLFVLQDETTDDGARQVLEHARAAGVAVLDLVTAFEEEDRADPTVRKRYFDNHNTAEGNRWVASHIARHIRGAEATEPGS